MNETDEECEEGEGTTPSGFGGGGVAVLFLCEPLPSFSSVSFMFRIETFDWLKPVSIKIKTIRAQPWDFKALRNVFRLSRNCENGENLHGILRWVVCIRSVVLERLF